ncbi:hypothetical protein evm_009681 [Chilo suppressalis]|nr:hypothetical protein evm_009681 [Chilo suppressalis]
MRWNNKLRLYFLFVLSLQECSWKNKKTRWDHIHVFPANVTIRAKWIKIIRQARLDEIWNPSKSNVIWSKHFEDDCFYDTKCGFKKIRKGSVPNKSEARKLIFNMINKFDVRNNDSETIFIEKEQCLLSILAAIDTENIDVNKIKVCQKTKRYTQLGTQQQST